MGHKKILAGIFVLGLLAFFIFFNKDKEPVIVGYIGSISGKYAAMGASGRNGAVLALEEINQKGGIKKRRVEFIVKDDAGDPAKSLEAAKELNSQGVQIIVGPFITASATAILQYINENKMLTIGPATAGENLANQDDFFIKLYPSTKTIGEQIAILAAGMDIDSMVIITDHRNKRFGDTMIEGFQPVYHQSGKDLKSQIEYYSNKEVSYFNLATEAMRQNPEGVFIISSPIDTALLAQNLKKINPDVQLFTSPWAISRELIENGADAVEGLRFFVPFISDDDSSRYIEFKDSYHERFGEAPTHVAIFNYEAVTMLARGLGSVKNITAYDVKSALLKLTTVEGLQSDFRLNATGDALRKLYLHEIKDSKFRPIGTRK